MKKVLLFLMVIFMVAEIIGCAPKESKDTGVRVGYFPNITHVQALVGKDNEFKTVMGDTSIDWKQFNAGSSEIEALLAGDIDIGYIGPGPAINGYIKSRGDLQIIAGASEGGAVIVCRNDLDIKDIKELSGKKIAVPQFGNTQHIVLEKLLDDNGLKETSKGGTVDIIQADNPDIKTLFDQKAIDVAFVPEPWGSTLIKEANAKIVTEYNDVWRNGEYPIAVIIARTEFIKEHPDIVEKFIKAHVEITDEIKNNSDEALDKANEQIKQLTGKELSQDIMSSSFKRLLVTNDPNKDAINEMAGFMENLGLIKGENNLDNICNLSILNKVLKEKGYEEIK